MSDLYDWARCDHKGIGQIGCPTCDPDSGRVMIRQQRLDNRDLRAEVERLKQVIDERNAHLIARGLEVERLKAQVTPTEAVKMLREALEKTKRYLSERWVTSSVMSSIVAALAATAEPATHHAGHSECVMDGDSRCVDTAEPATPTDSEQIYPCAQCGAMRTKAEGGTTFTVCDACWDAAVPSYAQVGKPAPTYSADDLRKVAEAVRADCYLAAGLPSWSPTLAAIRALDLDAIIAKAVK